RRREAGRDVEPVDRREPDDVSLEVAADRRGRLVEGVDRVEEAIELGVARDRQLSGLEAAARTTQILGQVGRTRTGGEKGNTDERERCRGEESIAEDAHDRSDFRTA